MAEKPLLKPDLPLFSLGSKTFGVYGDTYADKKTGQTKESWALGEVEAVVDPVKRTIRGFKPKFGGQRIQASNRDDLEKFLASLGKV